MVSSGASLGNQSNSLLPGFVGPLRRGSRTESSSPSRKIALTVPLGATGRSGEAGPLRELVGKESMHERLIDLKLVGVHPRRHAHTQSDDASLAVC